MRLGIAIFLFIVSQVFANTSGSMVVIADSMTKAFALDSTLLRVAESGEVSAFRKAFNPVRDSLINYYALNPSAPLDTTQQEVLLYWSCQGNLGCYRNPIGNGFFIARNQFSPFDENLHPFGQMMEALPQEFMAVYTQRKQNIDAAVAALEPPMRRRVQYLLKQLQLEVGQGSLSKQERKALASEMDNIMDSIQTDLGIYARAPRQASIRMFTVDAFFFYAKSTLPSTFGNINFLGGGASVTACLFFGDIGMGFEVGGATNHGEDLRYDGLYHKGGKSTSGVHPYLLYGYPIFDNVDHKFSATLKVGYYDGHSGDDSVPVEKDSRTVYMYTPGLRYEFSYGHPVSQGERGLGGDAIGLNLSMGLEANMHYADVVGVKAYIGVGLGLFD